MKTSFFISTATVIATFFAANAQNPVSDTGISNISTLENEITNTFMEYARINSQSCYPQSGSGEFSMTPGQKQMAELLAADARKAAEAAGAENVKVVQSADNYVYVTIPATKGMKAPVMGISCHLDVTPEVDFGDEPIIPMLDTLDGRRIIRPQGKTLLGADDKCGCSIAMTMLRHILTDGTPHGEIQFAFCPNEDVGMAADRIDTTAFNPEILFDVDGEEPYRITDSNFTAVGLNLLFKGNSVHPSDAKALGLGDPVAAASTFIAAIPVGLRPEHSEGKQGYIHPWNFTKRGNDVLVETRIRYFDETDGELYSEVINRAKALAAENHPNVKIETLYDDMQYANVAYTLYPASHELVKKAAAECGFPVDFMSSRGGTTASMFAAKGLKGGMCIFSGQHNAHSLKEYADIREMADATRLLLSIVRSLPAGN